MGLLARAEDRGLGLQTWELHRNLAPDYTVVVDMGELARGFPMHLERYGITALAQPGNVAVARFDGGEFVDPAPVRALLAACDVIYTAETFYDPRLPGWAAEAGCAVVVHVNPEFYRRWAELDDLPALRWWAPTPWRLEHLPASTRVVPVPVAGDRFRLAPAPAAERLRTLHLVGHQAAADRNGTRVWLRALRHLRSCPRVTLATQDPSLPHPVGIPGCIDVEGRFGVADYWLNYGEADVLVMPRRYGGLCLPVQEAMAAGLAVVMTDTSPNDWWPTLRVPTRTAVDFRTPGGHLRLADASPRHLAQLVDDLAGDPRLLLDAKRASVEWAQAHTWHALTGLYRAELERAAG